MPAKFWLAKGHFTWKYYIPLSIALSLVGFASGYTWYISLQHTPVAGNTALYQTAPVLVFLFSVCLLKEKVRIHESIRVGTSLPLCIGDAQRTDSCVREKKIGKKKKTLSLFIQYLFWYICFVVPSNPALHKGYGLEGIGHNLLRCWDPCCFV